MEEILSQETPVTVEKPKPLLKKFQWILFTVGLLLFFTYLKLPEDRIKNYLQGTLTQTLAQYDIQYFARESELSIGFGVSYTLDHVEVQLPRGGKTLHLDRIRVSPSLFSLLFGKLGGSALIETKNGEADISFALKEPEFEFSADLSDLEFQSLGLSELLPVQLNGIINGTIKLEGNLGNLSTANGKIDVELEKLILPEQSVLAFSLPRMQISESRVEVTIDSGKAQLKTVQLGSQKKKDDFWADLSGSIALGQQIQTSRLDVKAVFGMSENVLNRFSFLESFIKDGKQKDGSYAYRLVGEVYAPNYTPLKL